MTNLSAAVTAYSDAVAPGFDDEPDHGLRAAETRAERAMRLTERLRSARPTLWMSAAAPGHCPS
ncbi:hypothetical protein [Streptomyces sp. NPDC005181]|uniref:hypothetical protein n=1 Tax=Streptomyces sp. NPDC005181 TaxID=3156869 RepID=UPI0033B6FAFC